MDTADQAARALARWLAPYLADELGIAPGRSVQPAADVSEDYDDATCATYVSALGETVLKNGQVFFDLLAEQGEIGSVALAEAIGSSNDKVPPMTPRELPGPLTTPLKKRAKTLGLHSYPWRPGREGKRVVWFDRDGIAQRMVKAIEFELARREAISAD